MPRAKLGETFVTKSLRDHPESLQDHLRVVSQVSSHLNLSCAGTGSLIQIQRLHPREAPGRRPEPAMLKSMFKRGSRDQAGAESAAASLLQKLSDSFSVEEKRQACGELRQVLLDVPAAKSTISSFGLEVVCGTIRSDWNDEEVVRNSLECLAITVDSSYSESVAESRVNSEQLARTPGALALLFDALEYPQFHVKYFGLQVLRSIFEANQGFCQQQSLKLPNCMSGPLKLLGDQEVLRNESLLLLQCLVFKSKLAQDTAVRQGCLDAIFRIYENEDPMLNYAVIEDSLTLLRYVMEDNLDSQAAFCMSDNFGRFLRQWQTRVSCANVDIGVEQSRILSSEMGVIFAFLSARSLPKEIQDMLTKTPDQDSSLLVRLLLALVQIQGNLNDYTFSASAWDCLLELSRLPAMQQGNDVMGAKIRIQGQLAPIQLGSMYIALTSHDPMHQMSCMRFCVRSLWRDVPMQDVCVKQLFSSANASTLLFGNTRVVAELLCRSRCLMCLAPLCMKQDNREKLQSLQHNGSSLIAFCSSMLSKAILELGKVPEAAEVALNCTIFLAFITQDSPEAVAAFLKSISERPFLVSVLVSSGQFGDNEAIIKGICSLLVGISMTAYPSPTIDPAVLEDTIKEKVGLTNFLGHINFLAEQTANFDPGHLFNGVVPVDIFASITSKVKSRFYPGSAQVGGASAPAAPPLAPMPPPAAPVPPPLMHAASMAAQNGTSASNMAKSGKTTSAIFAPPAAPTSHPAPQPVQPMQPPYHPQAQTTQSTLLPDVSSPFGSVGIEIAQLKATIKNYEEEIAALHDRLAKTEGDLEALSQAYTFLDEHANTLQQQLDDRSKMASSASNGLDDNAIEDLLVCLGQEEEKNAVLEAELQALRLRHSS